MTIPNVGTLLRTGLKEARHFKIHGENPYILVHLLVTSYKYWVTI
jgi:hypothetical protein